MKYRLQWKVGENIKESLHVCISKIHPLDWRVAGRWPKLSGTIKDKIYFLDALIPLGNCPFGEKTNKQKLSPKEECCTDSEWGLTSSASCTHRTCYFSSHNSVSRRNSAADPETCKERCYDTSQASVLVTSQAHLKSHIAAGFCPQFLPSLNFTEASEGS